VKVRMQGVGRNVPRDMNMGGTLIMCGSNDFRETAQNDMTVVTLCRVKNKFEGDEHHHFYFKAFVDSVEIWRDAIDNIEQFLRDGKTVLVHCIHGRDRTGGVVYALLRRDGLTHGEAKQEMYRMRPRRAIEWRKILEDRKDFHEKLI